jgi:hypothetical protein
LKRLKFIVLLLCAANTSLFAGETSSDPVKIWEPLTSMSPAAKTPTKLVKQLMGHPIQVAGFPIINEFNEGETTEFLLARFPGGCIHVPLPPPNQMIHVTMAPGKSATPAYGQRVIVSGKLTLGTRIDAAYEMTADSVISFPL